jgi:hypothetical protein
VRLWGRKKREEVVSGPSGALLQVKQGVPGSGAAAVLFLGRVLWRAKGTTSVIVLAGELLQVM